MMLYFDVALKASALFLIALFTWRLYLLHQARPLSFNTIASQVKSNVPTFLPLGLACFVLMFQIGLTSLRTADSPRLIGEQLVKQHDWSFVSVAVSQRHVRLSQVARYCSIGDNAEAFEPDANVIAAFNEHGIRRLVYSETRSPEKNNCSRCTFAVGVLVCKRGVLTSNYRELQSN